MFSALDLLRARELRRWARRARFLGGERRRLGIAAGAGDVRALAAAWAVCKARLLAPGSDSAARHAAAASRQFLRLRLQWWRLRGQAVGFDARRAHFAAELGQLRLAAGGWRRWAATWRRERHVWLHRHRAALHLLWKAWAQWLPARRQEGGRRRRPAS